MAAPRPKLTADKLTADKLVLKCMKLVSLTQAKIVEMLELAPPGCEISFFGLLVFSKNGDGGDGRTLVEGVRVSCPEYMEHLLPNPPEDARQDLLSPVQMRAKATFFDSLRQAHRHQDDTGEEDLVAPQMRVRPTNQKDEKAAVREMMGCAPEGLG